MRSPYEGLHSAAWTARTRQLIDAHPLATEELLEIVQLCWQSIFNSRIGTFRIGEHLFPKPQIMGFFLHELIPLEIARRYPCEWRPERSAEDKDVVFLPDDKYSIEIKTSSSVRNIYGNRSYAQRGRATKKSKTGYYLAINFEKFSPSLSRQPRLRLVRFGWIDHDDWTGQTAATGQQARLSADVESKKLLALFQYRRG